MSRDVSFIYLLYVCVYVQVDMRVYCYYQFLLYLREGVSLPNQLQLPHTPPLRSPLYASHVRTYKDPSHHARYNDPIRLLPFIHSHSLFYLFYLLALPFIRVRLPLASVPLASSLLFYAALLLPV